MQARAHTSPVEDSVLTDQRLAVPALGVTLRFAGSSCGKHNPSKPGAAMRNAMKGHEARKKGPNPREEGGWN